MLQAEVARIKKLPKKPKIRPSTLPKDDDESDNDDTDALSFDGTDSVPIAGTQVVSKVQDTDGDYLIKVVC